MGPPALATPFVPPLEGGALLVAVTMEVEVLLFAAALEDFLAVVVTTLDDEFELAEPRLEAMVG